MIKTKIWVLGIAAVLLPSAAASVLLGGLHPGGTVANVYLDGECIRSIDLAAVKEAETFTVTCGDGENTILVEPGRICILQADCPDQVCVIWSCWRCAGW